MLFVHMVLTDKANEMGSLIRGDGGSFKPQEDASEMSVVKRQNMLNVVAYGGF